jgi:hypothetical protein
MEELELNSTQIQQLSELIRQEAVKLLFESAKGKADFIFKCYDGWKPSYPYGQFNKYPDASYEAFKEDVEVLRKIHDTKMDEYIEKNGRIGFVKVISGAAQR